MTDFFYYTKKKILGKNKKIYREKNSKKEYIKQKNKMVPLNTYIKKIKKNKIKKGGTPDIAAWKQKFEYCCHQNYEIPIVSKCLYPETGLILSTHLRDICKFKYKNYKKISSQQISDRKFKDYIKKRELEKTIHNKFMIKLEKQEPTFYNFKELMRQILEIVEHYEFQPEKITISVIIKLNKVIQQLYALLNTFVVEYHNKEDDKYIDIISNIISLNLNFFSIFKDTLYKKLENIDDNEIIRRFKIKKDEMYLVKELITIISNIVSYTQKIADVIEDIMSVKFVKYKDMIHLHMSKTRWKTKYIKLLYNDYDVDYIPKISSRSSSESSSRSSSRTSPESSPRSSSRSSSRSSPVPQLLLRQSSKSGFGKGKMFASLYKTFSMSKK
tara:strand:+ start:1340 stop:2494 length:1155 start_codon:yes stop_codon:yes gene_type:complete